jgi:predicted nucleic acid-binding protein
LYPGNVWEQHLLERAAAGDPIALTAPGVMEIAYGLARTPATRSGALAWFTRLAVSSLVTVLPLDAAAGVLAGRLRAAQPTPPTGVRRTGTKPGQRAGWVLDLQIAACAWAHGRRLATHNRRDFDVIAALIKAMYPAVPALDVVDPPGLTP